MRAQILTEPVPSPYYSIFQNSISNMGAFGDTLWIGPMMNYRVGDDPKWYVPENADSVVTGRGRLYSIALAPDTIVAGLGYSDVRAGESVATQMGIYISTDGGNSWSLSDTSRTLDHPSDTTIFYGDQHLGTIPVIVPQQSPPYKVDFRGDVIFFAGWASGIRRSTDFGASWERIVLPPLGMSELLPENNNQFFIDPRGDGQTNQHLNYMGFSVMIASDGTVYAGTAGGLNISDNALYEEADQIRWRNINSISSQQGLLGNWVTSIRENPFDNAIWTTNWISVSEYDQEGLAVTRDRGATFEHHLKGERIYEITFDGEAIFAAGLNGVFISDNNGRSWRHIRQIQSNNTFMRPNTEYYSAAKAGNRVWIASSDGLASTTDHGRTWKITRVDFPLDGKNQHTEEGPEVDAFAYPNPFSPRVHSLVRIKFEVSSASDVTIRLFDFSMNFIRQLDQVQALEPGVYEAVWDGTDQQGRKLANGTVFYEIVAGGKQTVGKILLLE
ncbi:FlgD immunoglobulin-like domain containing protein [Balneolaceae bacterium ANBcel3]|nr:FlgD immunoglobulin-like domain containing protein [Balneolaceae bacterium ANBcel3]